MRAMRLGLGAFLLTWTALAQTPVDPWPDVTRLARGSEIRVTLAAGTMVRGFLQSATPDGIAINAATTHETLARPDIRRVQLKKPGHRGRNTLIGMGVGIGVGFAIGAGIDHEGSGSFLPNAGKIVGTPMGLLVGTVVGVAWPTGGWRQLYRAP